MLSLQTQPGAIRLVFSGRVGESYAVEFTEDLSSPNWQVFREITGTELNTVELPDPGLGGSGPRFYRVRAASPGGVPQ